MTAAKPPLRCPACRRILNDGLCRCGFRARHVDGIVDLMTPSEERDYRPFLHQYEKVRASERWGDDDLDLPFAARRHHYVWNIRKRTFRRFHAVVSREFSSGGEALDVAAGNCWLSRHLVSWGFHVTALDISVGERDGLRAGAHYLAQGFEFDRVRAPAESLPFPDRSFDLIVVAGGFHYMDGARVLDEFHRVVGRKGCVVIFDSPWYERARDGDRAVRQRVRRQGQEHGLPDDLGRQSSYLLRERFEQISDGAGFTLESVPTWPGPRRAWDVVKARMKFQRMASFPILILRAKANDG